MITESVVIPKPAYNVLRRLTGESRPDVALSIALKDLVRLRLESAQNQLAAFEQKYAVKFAAFESDWKANKIPQAHSFAIEKDYQEWEAATSDVEALGELAQWLV
jgi:hypothetical protein